MRSLVKKIVPAQLVRYVRQGRKKAGLVVVSSVHKHRRLSSFYYFLVSAFSNEHQAVLKGRKAYHDSLKKIGKTCALLRRNTHRLEKGLIMKPRRSVFAEGFIEETVDCYKEAVKSTELAESEKKWATDVLDEYFRIIGSTLITDKARQSYLSSRQTQSDRSDLIAEFPSHDDSYKPYSYARLPDSRVSFSDLKQLFIRRRSVRWYQNRPVPLELVQKAANIASFAPSACNRQPYRFFFCNEKEKAIAIAKCAGGTTGFAENLPAIIAIVGDLSAYPYERDRHLIYIDGALATMQLMLALETLGLSTCSINWPEIDDNERELRKIISIKDYERVVMLLALGYPDKEGGIPYSQKKENSLVLENIN